MFGVLTDAYVADTAVEVEWAAFATELVVEGEVDLLEEPLLDDDRICGHSDSDSVRLISHDEPKDSEEDKASG